MTTTKVTIIRGPAGVGKTTIAKLLAKRINAKYISYDDVMKKNKLDKIIRGRIPDNNFIKSNKIVLESINKNRNSVLDGCFYSKAQLKDMKRIKPIIITLEAKIEECIKRNSGRKKPLSEKDIRQVHRMTKSEGVVIKTGKKTPEKLVEEIIAQIVL